MGKTVISEEVIEEGQPAGLSRVNSLPSVVVPNEDEVRDDEAGFHTTEVVVTGNNVVTGVEKVIEECEVSEKTISIPGKRVLKVNKIIFIKFIYIIASYNIEYIYLFFYLFIPVDIFDFLQSDWLQQRAAFYDILTVVQKCYFFTNR